MGRFWNQTEALLKKNLIYQKRHPRSIAWILLIPAVLFGILFGVKIHDHKKYEIDPARMPVESFPVLAIPPNWYRAVKTKEMPHDDLPDASCRKEDGSCPATFLITGKNRTFAESLAGNMYTNSSILNSTDAINIADGVWGTDNGPVHIDRISEVSLYAIESVCSYNSTKSLHAKIGDKDMAVKATCLQGLHLWRENYREINKELQGYYYERDSIMEKTNGIAAAYDFLDSNASRLNAHVWYNPTLKSWLMAVEVLEGVQAVLSTAWNAYLQFLKGPSIKMILEYVGEMGTPAGGKDPDMASEYAYFFFTWIFLQIFPVTLSSVVYEKQHRIRIMMKMHGLGDGAYWLITYLYFFVVGLIYMLQLVLLGSLSGLPFFSMNSYALQSLFYGIHMNLLIISAFILSGLFSSTKSASVAAYSLLFGTWICSETLFRRLIIDASFPRAYLVILELFPGFSLYRGIYEFQTYGLKAREMGTYGMRWRILRDKGSGIREVMIIVLAEWLFFLFIFALGNGFLKRLLSFTRKPRKSPSLPNHGSQDQDSRVLVQLDKQDIDQEKERVIELLGLRHPGYPIIADNLMKVYPGKHGAPEKYAVRGLSLAVARGECFGLLGPNGAGKTSFLNMMTGLAKPSSGTAIIGGRDLQKQMHKIYKSMGVCPQFNLLWDSLTGREHLQFYGN